MNANLLNIAVLLFIFALLLNQEWSGALIILLGWGIFVDDHSIIKKDKE